MYFGSYCLRRYFLVDNSDYRFCISLPGIDDFWITTIIVLLIIGFPISIIAGWIYEMTPDGIRKTDEVEVSEEFEELSDRKLNQIIIGVLATVIVFMVVERLFFAEVGLLNAIRCKYRQLQLPFYPLWI